MRIPEDRFNPAVSGDPNLPEIGRISASGALRPLTEISTVLKPIEYSISQHAETFSVVSALEDTVKDNQDASERKI